MKIRTVITIFSLMIGFTLTQGVANQPSMPGPPLPQVAGVPSRGVQLSIATSKAVFAEDEPINVYIFERNVGSSPLGLEPLYAASVHTTLYDSTGRIVPPSHPNLPGYNTSGISGMYLHPSEYGETKLHLNVRYTLPAGVYKLIATLGVYPGGVSNGAKPLYARIASNTISFQIK